VFVASDSTMSFDLSGSGAEPIVNPCFVIKGWGGDQRAALQVGTEDGSNVRQGIVRDVVGTRTMIIWLTFSSNSRQRFTISRSS
jgi:hypothetical protein